MFKSRIGKDLALRWRILTNGMQLPLANRDLKLVLQDRDGNSTPLPFAIEEGNCVSFLFSGISQKVLGVYSLTLWENKGKFGQVPVDKTEAFELVKRTEEENLVCASSSLEISSQTLETSSLELIRGIGIAKIEQTEKPETSGGVNVVTITLEDGRTFLAEIKNGVDADIVAAADATASANEAARAANEATASANEATQAANDATASANEAVQTANGTMEAFRLAEGAREAAENLRDAAESERAAAETLRGEETAAALSNLNLVAARYASVPKSITADFATDSEVFQWTNVYGPIHLTRVLGRNVASVKLSYGAVLEEAHALGDLDVAVADGDTVTVKVVKMTDGATASVTLRFGIDPV